MKKNSFNTGWLFEDEASGQKEQVTLPHDAMINTERNPQMRNYFLTAGFQGSRYRYTKKFFVPEEYRDKTVILEFEAVYCMSTVLLNGEKIFGKAYGYTPLQIPLTERLRFGEENTVEVIADVPKEGYARWYTGGGIYRPVNLYVGEKDHICLYGVKVTTLSIHPAKIRVDVEVEGEGEVYVEISKKGKEDGAVAADAENVAAHAAAAGTGTAAAASAAVSGGHASLEFTLENAALWSAETPELYCASVTLKKDGQAVDTAEETFGIRTIDKDPESGLLINGVPTFLRGGCIHNDNGVIGVINNDATELHRAKRIKESGFNAIRSAHHPMSRSLMKACDEVGLYVMDEAFDYWYRPKVLNPHRETFLETFREDTRLMVQDAYNHPCVILYSIGNEIPEAGGVKGVRVGKAIVEEIRRIDTNRLTTLCPSVHWLREYLDGTPYLTEDEDEWMAESPENKEADGKHYIRIFMGAAENLPDSEKGDPYPPTFVKADEDATKNLYPFLDVAGYNYYEDRYEKLHELHPERVLLGTETRGDRIVDTMRYARNHPFLIGDFIWTLQDHLGEVNCCNIRYGDEDTKAYPWISNYGGVIDLSGHILPAIHRYEFAWNPEKHGLYLASQPPVHKGIRPEFGSYKWTDTVDGWTYEGCEGEKTWVDFYTDADSVELQINGKTLGREKVTDYFAKIPCVYEPGILTGIGYDGDGKELYRTEVKTAGKETVLRAVPDKTVLKEGGEDFCFIEVEVTDSEGNRKLLPERKVSVQAEGCGVIQGFGSACHKNAEKYNQASHTTYLGRLMAVVRSTEEKGEIRIRFSCDGLEDAEVILLSE